jgi:hypothetical protein
MKKLLFITLVSLLSFSGKSQGKTYVEIFYGTVKNADVENHIKNEKATFAKMHADRIKRGEIVGWDMWQMISPGDTQGLTTFAYATIYNDLDKANLWGANISEYVQRAAGKNSAGFNAKINSVIADYTTMNDVITSIKGYENYNENTPMSSILVLNSMVVDGYHASEYEKMELETFKAYRKGNDKLKGWNLQKVLNSYGENKVNYYTADFYSSLKDLLELRDNTNDFSEESVKMLKDIDKIRTLKNADIYMLIDTKR